ncbi:MAG: tetrahydrodipicolinate N-succinyltransferase N-terminal domain-containing protein [Proteobacteria bacterium]|nr:tetrahydrodipicolinate N-succinyltransferase N-terminal domain-containing protein [Pseudomonadota bacterium]
MSDTAALGFGLGLATTNSNGEIIEVYYPQPEISPARSLTDAVMNVCGLETGSNYCVELDSEVQGQLAQALRESDEAATADLLERLSAGPQLVIACLLGSDSAPASVAEAYLKLHLLSHRLAKPNSLNLEGLFSVLVNIAWTNRGAIDLIDLPGRQLEARLQGLSLEIMSVDKFPRMTSYVVPTGVRIAHTARVRLGAYLGEGTTIMHEGFVNFNAGTEGPAMIEGRISAGVMVGANSDLGGGCSIMGTLSGGGREIISVGRNCLIGANAGIGFPLADGCIIEAGLYVTAGTKVGLLDANGELQKTVKAKELSGQENLLYRRNSLSGAVECMPLKTPSQLNQDLHSHN